MKRNSLTYGRNIVLLFILLLSHAAQAGNKTASVKDSVYLFTSFHEPSTEGLEYIYSYDCLHWDTVPNIVMRPLPPQNGFTVNILPLHEGRNERRFIQQPQTVALRSVSLSGLSFTAVIVLSALISLK